MISFISSLYTSREVEMVGSDSVVVENEPDKQRRIWTKEEYIRGLLSENFSISSRVVKTQIMNCIERMTLILF